MALILVLKYLRNSTNEDTEHVLLEYTRLTALLKYIYLATSFQEGSFL